MRNAIKSICTTLSIALVLGAMAGLHIVSAQSPVDYDADDDGLIEIEWLEQLNAIRWDLDGDGFVDDGNNAEAYAGAFPDAAEGMGCTDGCQGFELTRDLDFKSAGSYASGAVNDKWTTGNGWLPIGVGDGFRALFDGNGMAINNLFMSREGANQPEYIGLFASNRGEISRIGVVNVDVTGEINVGGLAGRNQGRITSSYSTGNVSGEARIGGLIGVNSGEIISSYASSKVSGGPVGGLVGRHDEGSITFSYATGDVSSDSERAGGLVGEGSSEITSSFASGNVTGGTIVGGLVGSGYNITSSYATGEVSGERTVGGLAGWGGGIVSSYASGRVSGESVVGGLVGFGSDITSSYASGSVSGRGAVGGLVGNGGNITSSYASGSVSGRSTVGGLVGFKEGFIRNSYAVGVVTGTKVVGGFVGLNEDSADIEISYWNTEISAQSVGVGEGSDTGVEGKTTAELQGPTDYTGIYSAWLKDLDNADEDYDETTGVDTIWDFGTSSQYPELKADLDDSGHASWWEFGPQHGRPAPTSTPTPLPTDTPTPTLTPTVTPTPTQTATPTNTPIPTDTPTATPTPTMTPIPTDTPVPAAAVSQTPVPAGTPAPTSTPEPTETPAQTAAGVVVTATPAANALSGGGCNSVGEVPAGTAAANLLFVVAPLGIIGGVRYRRRKKGSVHYE